MSDKNVNFAAVAVVDVFAVVVQNMGCCEENIKAKILNWTNDTTKIIC